MVIFKKEYHLCVFILIKQWVLDDGCLTLSNGEKLSRIHLNCCACNDQIILYEKVWINLFSYCRKRIYSEEDEVKKEAMDDDTASSWTDVETRVRNSL
jgi:hypothetical protein